MAAAGAGKPQNTDVPTRRLTWEDIQSRAEASIQTAVVQVDEWGGEVAVRGLYLNEARDVWSRAVKDGEADPTVVACYTVAYGMTDPRLPMEEAMQLGQHGAGVVFKLFKAIDNLTGVSDQEVRRATEAFRES